MLNLFTFKNKDNAIKRSIELQNYISYFLKRNFCTTFIQNLNKNLFLPIIVLELEFKQYIIKKFNFKNSQFSNEFLLRNSFFYFLKFFFFIFWVLIFSKKNKKENCEIIIDEINSKYEYNSFLELAKYFKSYKFISYKNCSRKKNIHFFINYKNCDRDYLIKNIFLFTSQNFYFLFLSIKHRVNLLPFFYHLIKRCLKYHTLFKTINAKYLFQERHYSTSSVKKYLFKIYGGINYSCLQRIIIHLGKTGHYIDVDNLFSLGNKTSLIVKRNSSLIQNIKPLGSYHFEYWKKNFFKKKFDIKKFEYDILIIGGNKTIDFSADDLYEKYYKTHLDWIAKISTEFKSARIAIKHHHNIKCFDKYEDKLVNNFNVKRIVGDEDGSGSSYRYALQSKIVLSWCSTMVYEILGEGKAAYFLDPNFRNLSFLHNYSFNKEWRINSYVKLHKIISDCLIDKKKIIIKNKQDFCKKNKNIAHTLYKEITR